MSRSERDTGICTLRTGEKTFHLLFSDGEAVDVQVVPQTQAYGLAPVLARTGVLETARIAKVNRDARDGGIDLGDALIASGLVTAEVVDQARRARLSCLLQQLLDAAQGAFYYTPLRCSPYEIAVAVRSW